ncbi:hypothetical protein N8275_10100 [Pseudomonadales bacterium]|nr:hypothetical protein [Pseudomonadales bacterium]
MAAERSQIVDRTHPKPLCDNLCDALQDPKHAFQVLSGERNVSPG